MKIRYFTPAELENYLANQTLNNDIATKECMGICSIADMIEVCENQKKGGVNISIELLWKVFDRLCATGFSDDLVYVVNLEREDLADCLFEPDGSLWDTAAQRSLPPLHSVRRLTLRCTEARWWNEETYQQMEDLF